MIDRKKKIRLTQIFLFFLGLIIFLFTYLGNKQSDERKILSKQTEKKFKENLTDKVSDKDLNVFLILNTLALIYQETGISLNPMKLEQIRIMRN